MLAVLTGMLSAAFAASDAVQVQLYFESMCPFCQQFITGTLQEAFSHDGFDKVANFTLYPFGNARETSNSGSYSYKCQHGERECQGNLVEACFVGLTGFDPSSYMPFVFAFESALGKDGKTEVMSLAKTAGDKAGWPSNVSYDDLSSCYTSPQGNNFQHQMAVLTNALSPSHQYVPWIVFNGVHDDGIQQACQENFLHCVCKAYTGTSDLCDKVNKFIVAAPTHKKIGHTRPDLFNMIVRKPIKE